MNLARPEWFLLLPVVALLAWRVRGLRLWKPTRIALCLLLVGLLVDPSMETETSGIDLWVLVDRSESAADAIGPNEREWESILRKSMGGADRLRFVDFAREAWSRETGEASARMQDRSVTNVALAIRQALLLRDPERATRLLLLSDGYATDDVKSVERRLVEERIPLDWRLSSVAYEKDARVSNVSGPQRARAGETFLVEAMIEGVAGQAIPYRVLRNEQVIRSDKVTLVNGRGKLQFSDRSEQASAVAYTVVIDPEGDPVSGNNRRTSWVQIDGESRILLVTNFETDPVEQALSGKGFRVEAVRDPARLSVASLTGISAVVINNVPANRIPRPFLEGLDFFVRKQGGGLLMLGGAYSFGSGGYFGSPVDPLIPVSMELKEEHKKLAVAMAIVVDRSGSMSAAAGGGSNLTKMDLANAGAVQATRMLGELDAIAYLAVDTEAHVMVPLTDVGENREAIIGRINRVASMGGGIYVFTGLKAGWEQLERSNFGQRHLVLFADASDAEEPGDYRELIKTMREGKTTVSVIAMGSPTDSDAAMLKDVADLGGGRIFFNDNPGDLPALFTQETVAVARSAFIEETLETKATAGWLELSAQPINWLTLVGGYNLSYLKDGATMALVSNDEYQAPLVAFWNRGVGRAAAVTFPMSGKFSSLTVSWPEYGEFTQTLVRWLVGERQISGVSYETTLVGDALTLDLYYDESWSERFRKAAPEAAIARGEVVTPVVWERIEPGHYQATRRIAPGALTRGAISLGESALPFGPLMSGVDEEWQRDGESVRRLLEVARNSGGVSVSNLSDAWKQAPSNQQVSLKWWLLLGILALLLLDVAETRLGFDVVGLLRRRKS